MHLFVSLTKHLSCSLKAGLYYKEENYDIDPIQHLLHQKQENPKYYFAIICFVVDVN